MHWHRDFKTVRSGGFKNGDIVWFPEGGLNVSYNCVDRWAHEDPDRVSVYLVMLCVESPISLPNPALFE